MVDMYNALKQAHGQSEELNEQAQKTIADLEEENKQIKEALPCTAKA